MPVQFKTLIGPSNSNARFYALAVQPTLFGEASLVRAWRRLGTRGQQMVHLFDNERQATNLFLGVLREKRKRGCRPKEPVDIPRI
ncbi:WGR domain-containing protein [Rhizobium sp. GR12]|uniref:WGR domain-containing protein n=1 Tax=Rhizobium sp. GR12 TaxID=3053925 RepID=UPI002FBE4966